MYIKEIYFKINDQYFNNIQKAFFIVEYSNQDKTYNHVLLLEIRIKYKLIRCDRVQCLEKQGNYGSGHM